jgi:hypothetical protein
MQIFQSRKIILILNINAATGKLKDLRKFLAVERTLIPPAKWDM